MHAELGSVEKGVCIMGVNTDYLKGVRFHLVNLGAVFFSFFFLYMLHAKWLLRCKCCYGFGVLQVVGGWLETTLLQNQI